MTPTAVGQTESGLVILSAAKNLSDVGMDSSLRFFLPLVVRMTAHYSDSGSALAKPCTLQRVSPSYTESTLKPPTTMRGFSPRVSA
jgi:hypothetical protein